MFFFSFTAFPLQTFAPYLPTYNQSVFLESLIIFP